MASSPCPEKSLGNPAFSSPLFAISSSLSGEGGQFGSGFQSSRGLLSSGTRGKSGSFSKPVSEVISMLGPGAGIGKASRMEAMVRERRSSVAVDSYCISMSRFIQELDILLLPLILGELLVL